MHWRSRPSLLTTTAGSSVAYERQVVGMTGRVLREGRRRPGGDGKGQRWSDTALLSYCLGIMVAMYRCRNVPVGMYHSPGRNVPLPRLVSPRLVSGKPLLARVSSIWGCLHRIQPLRMLAVHNYGLNGAQRGRTAARRPPPVESVVDLHTRPSHTLADQGCVSQPLSFVKFVVDWQITTDVFHNPCRALKFVRRCR